MSPPSPSTVEAVPVALQQLAEAVRPVAEAEPRILGVCLFGSRASGEEHPASDVDLGVLFSTDVGIWDLLGLQVEFEDALGCDVDLVDIGKARPYLALDIVRGERLYSSDPYACDTFDLYVLRRAADLAPFERQRRRMILGQEEEDSRR